jgi:hypothetical protein
MATYQTISDLPFGFSVEITFPSGAIQTTGGFATKEAADAWTADRIAAASDQRTRRGRDA